MSEQRSQAIKNAGLKSRRAMVWLRDHKLPADPVCYTIAYEYLHSERPKLKSQIDSLDMNDESYLSQIKKVYEQCIIAEDFQKLAMSGDIGNQYVNEILSLLLSSQEQNDVTNDGDSATKPPAIESDPEAKVETEGSPDEYIHVAESASKDELTTALDFDGLKQSMVSAIKHSENFPMSILRINLDHFKQFNDTNGKFMGDAVLKNVVKTINNQLKGNDLTCRFESDEFLVVLPHTDVKHGVAVADKLRQVISGLVLKKKNSAVALKFTVSIGVAVMKKPEAFESALAKCNKALARSKDLGRNCVNKDD